MMPPLEIDRSALIAARIKAYRARIMRARTYLTVNAVIAAIMKDVEISKTARKELQDYANKRLERLGVADARVVTKVPK